MAYTTLENLKKRIPEADLIELTDDGQTGDVDAVIVDQALRDATVQIESKLRGRYPLPFSPVPAALEQIATILTIHNIYSRKHELAMSDGLARQYKKALADLDELQDGRQVLEGFEAASAHPAFIATNKKNGDRVFTKCLLDQMP